MNRNNLTNYYNKRNSYGVRSRYLKRNYGITLEDYDKLSDIVEVWFDSGSTHSFVLEKRKDLKRKVRNVIFH